MGILGQPQLLMAVVWICIFLTATTHASRDEPGYLAKRQAQFQYIADEADPLKAAADIQQMPNVPGNFSAPNGDWLIIKDDGNYNPAWLAQIPFIATPDANQTTMPDGQSAWNAVPELQGFSLNRTFQVLPGLKMPFYVTTNYQPGQDNSAIKRVIIAMPGKPRDSWKYANLFRNALSIAANNTANGVIASEVMILAPIFLNSDDKDAGSVQDGELYWHGSQWQSGHHARNLGTKLSSYHVLDNLTDWLFFSGEFPGLKQVVLGGHSMGGQAIQRYSLLKKTKTYDPNMQYWVGNPGSWAWIDDQRPYQNASCANADGWGYGIGNVSSIIGYARRDVNASKEAVVERFRTRKVHYALGLVDTGQGDTHCQASMQGGSHLDRGSQFVLSLGRTGGFPESHSLDIIEGTSHQDYPMIRADKSVRKIFMQDYNTSYPFLDNVTNPGDRVHKKHDPKAKPPLKPKRFATPKHRIIATGLLTGSILFIVIFFTTVPFLFGPNYSDKEHQLEMEYRRQLLR